MASKYRRDNVWLSAAAWSIEQKRTALKEKTWRFRMKIRNTMKSKDRAGIA